MFFTNKRGERFDRTTNYFFVKNQMKDVDIPLKITINHSKQFQVNIKSISKLNLQNFTKCRLLLEWEVVLRIQLG